jgi:Raf kinase inhibitor-like YbhB/YbcL family protein
MRAKPLAFYAGAQGHGDMGPSCSPANSLRIMLRANWAISVALLATGLSGALPTLTTPSRAAEPFVLTSSAFPDGGRIPVRNAGNLRTNANCVGQNISPALSWTAPPDGTKSFALILSDLEARSGFGIIQTIMYGMPAQLRGFAEGEFTSVSDKFTLGKSSLGAAAYVGPCSPAGPPYHYLFLIVATDFEPQTLPGGLTRHELFEKLQGHAKAAAGLIGLFSKP